MHQIFKFNDEVHAYQKFVRENIKKLGNLTIISEQLLIKDIDKGFIDVLALDVSNKQIVVLELKNSSAGDDIVGQSIKYYDFLKRAEVDLLDLLAKMKSQFDFNIDEINLTPRIMLIVPDFSQQLLRSLSYVKGIEIDVIKFNAMQKQGYYEITKEVYVPNKEYREDSTVKIDGELTQTWNFEEYAKIGVDSEKIKLAQQFVTLADGICKSRGNKLDVYFYKDKITLMTGKKVVAHAKIQRKWFDNSLDISVSIKKDKKVNVANLMYNGSILKFDVNERNVKLKCSHLPTDILKDIL